MKLNQALRIIGLQCSLGVMASVAGTATISVDTAQRGARVNPALYGIFLEEINHGVDGGLYGELIANRAFENSRPPEGCTLRDSRWVSSKGWDSGFQVPAGRVPSWTLIREGAARGAISLETTNGLNAASPYCLRLDVERSEGGRIGVANEGFWGIGVNHGARYTLRLYARASSGTGPIAVRLENARGEACSSEAVFKRLSPQWTAYDAVLKGSRDEARARLAIVATGPGQVWLDFVSLFPAATFKGRANGMRADIAGMLAAMKPGFVRFPGGCVVEGGNIESAYDWKLTVGPVEQRPERWGAWNYRRTHGMGLYEYLQFCEDLGAAPLYVGFAGQTCLFRRADHTPMEQMGPIVSNFLDVVDFANGPTGSAWGGLRARMGHRRPFGLNLVEIGNENGGAEYERRYRLIHKALKKKAPGIDAIADYAIPQAAYDIVDEHYYNTPSWFLSAFNHYDGRDRRSPKVYVGEYAVTGGAEPGCLLAALSETVFALGMERNGDLVRYCSYAPLLAHEHGHTGWHGMINFNSTQVYGTASYHAGRLLAENRVDVVLKTDVQSTMSSDTRIRGRVGLGTWDTQAEFKDVCVEKEGGVLYRSSFDTGAEGWQPQGGTWKVTDGVYAQQAGGTPCLSLLGQDDWSDYTLTLKARKTGGAEGFLIVFGAQGDDRYWWNIGGWQNREHGLELNREPVGSHVGGTIERGKWYDIKVEVKGTHVRCSLDGRIVHETDANRVTEKLFAMAGRDEKSGEIVIKAVNMTRESVATTLKVPGSATGPTPTVATVLTAATLANNNSFSEPEKVVPKPLVTIRRKGPDCEADLPPHSFTVIRLRP